MKLQKYTTRELTTREISEHRLPPYVPVPNAVDATDPLIWYSIEPFLAISARVKAILGGGVRREQTA